MNLIGRVSNVPSGPKKPVWSHFAEFARPPSLEFTAFFKQSSLSCISPAFINMVFLARKGKMVDVPAPAKEKTRKEKEEDDDDDDDDVSSREAEADSAQPAEQAPSTGQSSRSHHSEYKFGIAERLTRAVKEKALENEAKRSPDLVPLSKQFDAMRKRLRAMIQTAKQYKKSMEKVDDDRMQVCEKKRLTIRKCVYCCLTLD